MTDIHALVADIYDAGLDAARGGFLRNIGALLHSSGVNLFTVDRSTNLMPFYSSWNIPEDGMAEYQHFIKLDPRIKYAARHPQPEVYYDYLHTDEAGIDRDPYYAWCRSKGDFRYYVGRVLSKDDRYQPMLAVQRGKNQ